MLSLSLMLLGWIFMFVPPFQKLLTYLHEFGHSLHLTCIIRKYNLDLPNPKIHICPSPITVYCVPQYQGKTFSNAYSYLEQNELAMDIIFNALSGFSVSIFVILLPAGFLCFLSIEVALGYLFGMLPTLILLAYNFVRSSDWEYIWNPKAFCYTSVCRKCGFKPLTN